eukprot:2364268-Pleurochrysis_carterae.AAC.1
MFRPLSSRTLHASAFSQLAAYQWDQVSKGCATKWSTCERLALLTSSGCVWSDAPSPKADVCTFLPPACATRRRKMTLLCL